MVRRYYTLYRWYLAIAESMAWTAVPGFGRVCARIYSRNLVVIALHFALGCLSG